ncbi:hypothetical protein J7L48_01725 [bacterium]|nr:hypothetical protein [bacterium]
MNFKDYLKEVFSKKLGISSNSITDRSKLYKDLNATPEIIRSVIIEIESQMKKLPPLGLYMNNFSNKKEGVTFGDVYRYTQLLEKVKQFKRFCDLYSYLSAFEDKWELFSDKEKITEKILERQRKLIEENRQAQIRSKINKKNIDTSVRYSGAQMLSGCSGMILIFIALIYFTIKILNF